MKETIMLLKVDLQCPCCYKKIKTILCKFPQIKDQVYDDKGNKVKITVLCCNPEKIRDKLRCEGGKVITSIEIIEPQEDKKTTTAVTVEPPQKGQNPKQEKNPTVKSVEPQRNPVPTCCGECYEGHGGGPCCQGCGVPPPPCYDGCGRDCHMSSCDRDIHMSSCDENSKESPKTKPQKTLVPLPNPPKEPEPVPVHVFLPLYPVRTCCGQCYEGHGGGPCYHGYGVPPPCYGCDRGVPLPPCHDGYGCGSGTPCYGGYGCGRDCHMNRCDNYLNEVSSCSIM